MVRLSWQDGDHSVVLPAEVSEIRNGLTSWELAGVTLPGCLICLAFPRSAYLIVSLYRLVLGTLYPAYASYKAIRNKDVEEYVRFSCLPWKDSILRFILFFTGQVDDVLGRFRTLHNS